MQQLSFPCHHIDAPIQTVTNDSFVIYTNQNIEPIKSDRTKKEKNQKQMVPILELTQLNFMVKDPVRKIRDTACVYRASKHRARSHSSEHAYDYALICTYMKSITHCICTRAHTNTISRLVVGLFLPSSAEKLSVINGFRTTQ